MVSLDIHKFVRDSVTIGLKKVGLPVTPVNERMVLRNMHAKLLEEEPSAHAIRNVLHAIEDEVMMLEEASYTCPRCGGDHSWCNVVQPGEYGPE